PLTMQRMHLGRCTDVATWGIPTTVTSRMHVGAARPNSPSERIDQAEPITAASVWSFSRRTGKGSRDEQGRRVSASCTTVPRDGAHVWRPRCAGYPSPHGAGLAAVGRYDRTRAEKATHRPTATASSAQKRREGIAIWIEPNAL